MSAILPKISLPALAGPRIRAPVAAAPAYHPDYDGSQSSEDGSVGPREAIAPFKIAVKPVSAMTVAPRTLKLPAAKPLTTVELFTEALAFLPLDDIEAARCASADFAAAADAVAPKPLPSDDAVFVRWEPQELHTAVVAPKGRSAGPAIFPWRCLSCGTITQGPRQCGTCRAPLTTSACRVFLGQLRKDLSAELATAMLRSLLPDVTILHIESHTNGADGRGKGCAWAYVSTVPDALRVTELHKRVFVDLDADNGEGFWFVKDPALIPYLGAMAETLGSLRTRPVWLPRQPLVAELPAKSMLAEYAEHYRL